MISVQMIRHENDVTNHRIMWLLIGQGFIANAYVSAERRGAAMDFLIPFVGDQHNALGSLDGSTRATSPEDILSSWASKPSRVHCRRNTCQSWDGRERGSKVGGGTSGYVHGSSKPVICLNHGCCCRAFSC